MAHPLGISCVLRIGEEQALYGVDARDLDAGPDQQYNAIVNGWVGQHKPAKGQQIGRVDWMTEVLI